MKTLPIFLLVSLAGASVQAAGVFTAVRTYDSTSNANSVDASATTLTAAQFTLNVAAAYDAGIGGVLNFDDYAATSATTAVTGPYTVNYGTSVLTMTGGGSINMNSGNVTTIAATPLSGTDYYRLGGATTTFTFSTYLSEFGFTLLARNTSRVVTSVTGTYSDGTTFTASASPVTIGASGSGGLDTFFGFTAATGKAIASVSINGATDSNLVMDDFGFIVSPIPEPTVSLLSAAGLAGLVLRRRRN